MANFLNTAFESRAASLDQLVNDRGQEHTASMSQLLESILPHDDSALQWSELRGGIGEDLDAVFERLHRIFLTTCTSFKGRISERKMGHSNVAEVYRYLPMPHFIWVCEISTPDDYEKEEIHGELIWDATRNGRETAGMVALHLPELVFYDKGSAYNRSEKLVSMILQGSQPYGLYVSNLQNMNGGKTND
ncbi:MAG: hypothetical protein ACPGSB_02880 [Opitutales bacterium]